MLILFKKEKKDKQRTGTGLINSGLLTEIGLEYVVLFLINNWNHAE